MKAKNLMENIYCPPYFNLDFMVSYLKCFKIILSKSFLNNLMHCNQRNLEIRKYYHCLCINIIDI